MYLKARGLLPLLFGVRAPPNSFYLQIRTSTTLNDNNLQNRYLGLQSDVVTSSAAAAVWVITDGKLREAKGPDMVYGCYCAANNYQNVQISVPPNEDPMAAISGDFAKEEVGAVKFLEWSSVAFGEGASFATASWCVIRGQRGQEVAVGPIRLADGARYGDKVAATHERSCVASNDPIAGRSYFLQAIPAEGKKGLVRQLFGGIFGSS